MLNVEVKKLEFDPETKLTTLTGSFEGEEGFAKAKIVVGHPTYF